MKRNPMFEARHVFCSVVTYNSDTEALTHCLHSLAAQEGFTLGETLHLVFIDNGSERSEAFGMLLQAWEAQRGVRCFRRVSNIGFAGAQNQAAKMFMESQAEYFMLLNPDVRLDAKCIRLLVDEFERSGPKVGMVTPKLYRADERLEPLQPPKLDAAGMCLTGDFRHLDRLGGLPEIEGEPTASCEVFGGSGACLMLRRSCLEACALPAGPRESDKKIVCPELAFEEDKRFPLFDEAFFAYREDAELAFRARRFGWSCRYVPAAIGYHKRRVTPERRSELPPEINLFGVRNRFLLQFLHLTPDLGISVWIRGGVVRNLVVLFGVLLREWSSLPGIIQALRLFPRALFLRRWLRKNAVVSVREWFQDPSELRK
jgi:GT2 family glycosyltransferase